MSASIETALKQNQLLIHALAGLMESLREHYELPAEEVEQNVGPIYDLAIDVSTELIVIRESLRDVINRYEAARRSLSTTRRAR